MKTKEDFLTDPEFVDWVKQPNEQLDAYWSKWMAANPEHVGELKEAREILLRVRYSEHKAPKGAREDILQGLLREPKQQATIKKNTLERQPIPGWKRIGQFHRISAILLLSFGLGWWLSPMPTETAPGAGANETVWIEKTTQPGEKLQLTLGDGSRIWLNANSRLFFPERFDSLERNVRLVGEAYFEVVKDSLRPFHVETNSLLTTVLGTTFNIRNLEGYNIDISLVSGSVKVTEKALTDTVWLEPGESLHHDGRTGRNKVSNFDSNVVLAWKEGWIRFDRASLEEVIQTLENGYGVEIEVQGTEPASWQFSGEYKEQSLKDVLRSMAYIKGFQFNIEEKVVHIKL
ncbi:FecR family protein [Cyclobacterium jeungdonense]|uniref:FecR domain-containing protein n=1 Tax=Cyclobacterium jeungdonense TaxID=708087 RepID=A0ABT8C0A6_9BACT|nr:FecR family protein [Cyclobacterium jeungdonense]MDN3686228.1 FecR domain-containing protein [Cyclobacterium jeungdonense]